MSIAQAERQAIIGGSDIAAVMGLSRWKTPLQLWAEKSGKIENQLGNFEAAEIGTELEEYVSNWFSKTTGIKLRRDSRTFRHAEFPYMVAHIDRWVIGQDALFEAKTASAWKVKEWDGEKIPQEYVLQVMWYLGILKKKTGYIAVLIGGQKRLWKEITFDKDLFEQMVAAAKAFKENYLDTGEMPVALAGDNSFIDELWPAAKPESVAAFEGERETQIDDLIEQRVGGLLAIKDAEKELDAIEAQLKQALGDSEMGTTRQYVITWKNQVRESADTAKLKADGLFDQYKKATVFRALRTKKVGGDRA